ncbi:MAG TPA: saccharopine dehydrogenase C-terminal domain-containing protein [Planctomycetota bacterium]|nr:saccharopine dehydrogenase C-terminal domain-containing protein [Planctomycetota bacterium]
MKSVLVVGAGRVGRTIVHMLSAEGSYRIRVADANAVAAARVAREAERTEAFPESVEERPALERAMAGCAAVVSAAPFTANPRIAEAARAAGVAYLDLTEDVEVTQFVKEVAEGARTAFVPQCGVAPGFVTLAGTHIIEQFDEVDTLTLRVGALPEQPNNRLKYNLTWSTEGLVNEYLHPCEALREGKLTLVPPLEQREEVIIGGVTYEAFTTSGGVGTLCHSCEGRIRQLDYKTIRYPGHLDLIRFLIDDLGFRDRPDELVKIFQRSIPSTLDDYVIVSVRGLGTSQGRYMEKTYWRRVNGRYLGKQFFTGIEVSTAAGVCGVLHLLLLGELPQKGLVMLEQVPYDRFMETPFGLYYARPGQAGRMPD